MRKMLAAAALALAALSATAAAAADYGNLFVFGDSLVDSGNARFGRLQAGGADPAPPELGYFQGRFSNGYNFADDLSFRIGAGPATAYSFGGRNFAVGGAMSAEVAGDESPSFVEQLATFTGSGQTLSGNSLVLVTLGGNDVRAELAKAATIPGYTPNLNPAIAAMGMGLKALLESGARNIVVTGLPDIGQIPAVTGLNNPALSALGRSLSFGLSAAFRQTVGTLAQQTGYNLQFFDLFAYQAAIYANPSAYGLTSPLNTRDACLLVPGAGPACNGYVYFDTIHPTAPLHLAIANGIAAQVGAVPEPSSWIVLIVGFGAVGATARRRSARPALA